MLELMKNQWILLLGEWIVFSLVFGVVLFFIFYGVFKLKAVNSPKKRYGVALAAIAFLFVASIVTISILAKSKVDVAKIVDQETTTSISQQFINFNADSDQITSDQLTSEATIDYWSVIREKYTPFLGIAWLLGVCLLSIRYLGGYAYLWRLNIVANVNFPSAWSRKIESFKTKVGIKGVLSLKMSERISAPLTFGFWKPVIIVPIGFFSGLSTEQAEAILIHELYHIKHRDFIINSALSLMEIIFFYHPLIWWLLAIVREERENYCDDQTVKLMGNPMSLAKALTQVEANKQAQLAFALHFSNNKNTLTERIMRLFEPQIKRKNPWKSLVGLVLLLMIATGFTLNQQLSNKQVEVTEKQIVKATKPLEEENTISVGFKSGEVLIKFNLHSLYAVNNSEEGKIYLDDVVLNDMQLVELGDNRLYFYTFNDDQEELRFFTKNYAESNKLDPYKLKETDKYVTILKVDSKGTTYELFDWDDDWNDDWGGWGSKEKTASDELTEEEQEAVDPWNSEAHLRYFDKGGKGLIGYHNFGWSKDAETGRYVFELVDATKEPLVFLNGKEISWKEFSVMQLKIGQYEYHIYDNKDGVENFGEKAQYGAFVIKSAEPKDKNILKGEDSGNDNSLIKTDSTRNSRSVDEDQKLMLKATPGVKFSKSEIQRTMQEIAQLGYFDQEGGKSTNSKNNTNDKNNASNDPLFILDGKMLKSKLFLKDLNPDDIGKINVLRDLDAIGKYGEKGQYGVVEIYTKKFIRMNGETATKRHGKSVSENEAVEVTVNENAKPASETKLNNLSSSDDMEGLLKSFDKSAKILEEIEEVNKTKDVDVSKYVKLKGDINESEMDIVIFIDGEEVSNSKKFKLKKGTIESADLKMCEVEGEKTIMTINFTTKK